MASLGDLVVNLRADNSHFQKNVKQSQGAISSFAAAVAAIGAGVGLAKLAADAETLQLRFKSLLKSGSAAAAMLDEIGEFAANTPFGKIEIADATRTLLGFQMGAQESLATVKNLGEVAAQSGARMSDLANILGKAVAKNKVEAETLNQLIERQVPILRALAQVTGESEASLYKLASAGAISGEDLQAAFTLMGTSSDYAAGAMAELATTTAGQWSTMIDNATLLGEKVGKVLLPPINATLSAVTKLLQQFSGFATVAGSISGVMVVAAAAVWATQKAIAAFTTAMNIARSAQIAMLALQGPSGWAAIAAGVAIGTAAIYAMNTAIADTTEEAAELQAEMQGVADAGNAASTWEPPIVEGWRDVEQLMNSIRKPRPNDDIEKFKQEIEKLGDDLERADRLYDVFATHSLNANMSLETTLKKARMEMSGFNAAVAEAQQELAYVQDNMDANQRGNAEFIAMGVDPQEVERLAQIQREIDEVTEARERERQATADAARQAEQAEQRKLATQKTFNEQIRNAEQDLRVQLGLISEIDAAIEDAAAAGASPEQQARLREIMEAQKKLDDASTRSKTQFAGITQRGSAEAFKLIASSASQSAQVTQAGKATAAIAKAQASKKVASVASQSPQVVEAKKANIVLAKIEKNTKPQQANGPAVQEAV